MSSWRENPNLILEDEGAYNEFLAEIKDIASVDNWESSDDLDDLQAGFTRYLKPEESTNLIINKALRGSSVCFVVYYKSSKWIIATDFVRRLRVNNISDDEDKWIQSIKNYIKVEEVGVW